MGTRADPANPGSKGCGAVMRSAPYGLLPIDLEHVWDLAVEGAVLTHGHPSGYLAPAALAWIIRELIDGAPLLAACESAVARLRAAGPEASETVAALEAALDKAASGTARDAEAVEALGAGWVAEEALAIAVYCSLAAAEPLQGLLAAVNHSGDSDSTGAIAGNLLGAAAGDGALPRGLVEGVEARDLLLQLAEDFVFAMERHDRPGLGPYPPSAWRDRYPRGG